MPADAPTLADLQAERERLRAAGARTEFEAALAETVSGADVQTAGQALRRALLDALDALAGQMAGALDGERDETRAHFRLSEFAHQ